MKTQLEPEIRCSLCESTELSPVKHQHLPTKSFHHCLNCNLIFVDQQDHPSVDEASARYQKHENPSADQGYLLFLQQLIKPLRKSLANFDFAQAKILDYGCGPNPALGEHLKLSGILVENYDPLFFPRDLRTNEWDMILSTEVFEHFRTPVLEISRLNSFLKNDSYLAVMTQFHQGPAHFSNWWYARDLTHLSFYSDNTMQWIAKRFGWQIVYLENPIGIFKKTPPISKK